MEFAEFVAHYAGLDTKERDADLSESIVKMMTEDGTGDSFGALMVRKAVDRSNSKAAIASRNNGLKAARPRTSAMPKNTQELYDRATRLGVDHADARDCYEATKARGGKDADGNNVTNFDGYLIRWGKTAEANRRKNG